MPTSFPSTATTSGLTTIVWRCQLEVAPEGRLELAPGVGQKSRVLTMLVRRLRTDVAPDVA